MILSYIDMITASRVLSLQAICLLSTPFKLRAKTEFKPKVDLKNLSNTWIQMLIYDYPALHIFLVSCLFAIKNEVIIERS